MSVEPKYRVGDSVVIKSYPKVNPLEGDPNQVPPIMVVTGVEVENKKKKTHDNQTGRQIAERIKYHLIWFDNKKYEFVEKILYESMLDPIDLQLGEKCEYEYGEKVVFKTRYAELDKTKVSSSNVQTKYSDQKPKKALSENGEKNKDNVKDVITVNPLVTFSSPVFLMSGVRKEVNNMLYDDHGGIKKHSSDTYIKIMYFNPTFQKYSEFEIPRECLMKEIKEKDLKK